MLDQGDAVSALDKAVQMADAQPANAAVLNLLGIVHSRIGNLEAAIEQFAASLSLESDAAEVHFNLGNTQRKLGHLDEAERCYLAAIAGHPNYATAHGNLGGLHYQRHNYSGAITHLENAVRLDNSNVEARTNLGKLYIELKRPLDAREQLQQAVSIRPDHLMARRELGRALAHLGEFESAQDQYARALDLSPRDAETYNYRGSTCLDQGDIDEAIVCFGTAIDIQPERERYHCNLADTLEKSNNISALEAAINQARYIHGMCSDKLQLLEVKLLYRRGDYAAALSQLDNIHPRDHDLIDLACRAEYQGKCFHEAGQYAAAFDAFARANSFAAAMPSNRQYQGVHFLDRVKQRHRTFEDNGVGTSRSPGSESGIRNPAFMIGFPRSGTTLLDTILRGHSDIALLEEYPLVDHLYRYTQGGASADIEHIREARKSYWDHVEKILGKSEYPSVIIDRQPFNTINAAVIHGVFPTAKFILCIRHPCDVVLSCFMQQFKLTNATACFLELADSAELYNRVMSLWVHLQEALLLNYHTVKYEGLLSDFDGTLKPLLRFLDCGWQPGLRQHPSSARARNRIHTASYSQVIEPIYTHARGRWENYREQMAPVLPVLLKWADHWGYERPEWAQKY